MILRLLSLLFPPKLPSRIEGWEDRTEAIFDEQGSIGKAKPKLYRDGIERHFAESGTITGRWYGPANVSDIERPFAVAPARSVIQQAAIGARILDNHIQKMEQDGYIRTIHDEWVKIS